MDRTTRATLRHLALALAAWSANFAPTAWSAADDHPPANPTGGGGTVILEPVPAVPVQRRQRTVFVCAQDGAPVFADRPCGPAVETRVLELVAPAPGMAPSTLRVEPKAATRPLVQRATVESPRARGDGRCEKLREQLEAVDGQMRAGYSAREAARLWNRWRDLKARIHAASC